MQIVIQPVGITLTIWVTWRQKGRGKTMYAQAFARAGVTNNTPTPSGVNVLAILIGVGVLAILAGVFWYSIPEVPTSPINLDNYNRLKVGMTRNEVETILGPGKSGGYAKMGEIVMPILTWHQSSPNGEFVIGTMFHQERLRQKWHYTNKTPAVAMVSTR